MAAGPVLARRANPCSGDFSHSVKENEPGHSVCELRKRLLQGLTRKKREEGDAGIWRVGARGEVEIW